MRPGASATAPDAAPVRGVSSPQESRSELAGLGLRAGALLHSGTLAEVWRAEMPSGETVAVKLLKPQWRADPRMVALLRREYRLLEMLRHPHIVRAVAWLEQDGCPAMATEYLEAGDLVSLAGAAPAHWIAAAAGVLSALRHLHTRGYVHADLKSRNVRFATGDRAKLIDFGSAQAIGSRARRGGQTPAYRPLRAVGTRAAPADDVYAYAVLLYELLSGRLPFGAEPRATPGQGADAGRAPRPPLDRVAAASPSVGALAERVIATLTAADPAGMGTLTDFANVIESVLSAPGV